MKKKSAYIFLPLPFNESFGSISTTSDMMPSYSEEALLMALNVTKVEFFSLDVTEQE